MKTIVKQQRRTITGRTFERKPRRSVRWMDDLARWVITLSGIGSIVAVSLVGLFLCWVVWPLFSPTGLKENGAVVAAVSDSPALFQSVDNYGSLVWSLHQDGTVQVRDLDQGRLLHSMMVRADQRPTCWNASDQGRRLVFGYDDGSVSTATLEFEVQYFGDDELTPEMLALAPGQRLLYGHGLVEKTNENQIRYSRLELQVDKAVQLSSSSIKVLGVANTTNGLVVVALDTAGRLYDRSLTWRKNLLTGNLRIKSKGTDYTSEELEIDPSTLPSYLALNDAGDMVLLVCENGVTNILSRGAEGTFENTHQQSLLVDESRSISSLGFLAGQVSLAVGDDLGGLMIWLPVRKPGFGSQVMEPVHDLTHHQSPVTALAAAGRSRSLAVGYADGTIEILHVTSKRFIGETTVPNGPVTSLSMSPREDLLVASTARGFGSWELKASHPDISIAALIKPIWYEGYNEPAYVWQSSSASDTFEQKLSLIPLVFGTLKATFYSMLFGLPLALLAAFYTSEFLPRKSRAKVKPIIEIMASLPSVVLGFLAALVVAPVIEKVVPQTLAVLFLVPFFILLGAHFWQILPRLWAPRMEPYRPLAVLFMLMVGGMLAWQMGPELEGIFFHGDLRAWLEGRVGSGTSGWFLLLLPVSGMLVGWLSINYGEGLLRSRGAGWTTWQLALLDLGRFLMGATLTAGIAWFLGWLLSSSGWDPRGGLVGSYVQRNALIVGMAMGFAVIPIIYSIAEDALSSVPDHLRAASLGAGATTWQTAIRVVAPPAASGLFSAGMIGLGRAVGETMIVLMAAGNTPIMEMNIFSGFRTLSANLAVELPEAVQGSTHFRTLFLAALTLFVMTFVLNTVAELVRLHFRRKSSRL